MIRFYDRRQLVAGTVAALLVGTLTASLGFWQLRRAELRAEDQRRHEAALAAAPREFGAALGEAGSVDGMIGARVRLSGRFDAARTVFLDNRTRQGVSGFHVVAPMRLEPSGRWVLVLRGWIAGDPAERMRLPALTTPAGTVTIEGVVEAELDQPMLLAAEPEPGPGDRIWQRLDYPKYARWSGLAVLPVVVRQNAEPALADGLARDWIQPGMTVDRHLGYAFQWFAMTAVTLAAWGLLLRRLSRRPPPSESRP